MQSRSGHTTIHTRTVVIICAMALVGSLWYFVSTSVSITKQPLGWAFFMAVVTIGGELLIALAVMLSAGGWGYLAFGRLMPRSGPAQPAAPEGEGGNCAAAGLVLVTAVALGYLLLSTALLVVGSLTTGLLRGYIWWPVVGAGIALALWQGRKAISKLSAPKFFDARFIIWVLLFIAAGAWLTGACMPPRFGLFGDGYDVQEYHLQLPREFLNAQHVAALDHNVYSHYPLGGEMLFLLAMILRGGAYEGMYAAQFTHGLMAVLAVVAMFAALRRDDDRRARYSMLLLATTPFVLYLSWLAFSELAEILYLTLAVLWMRHWIASSQCVRCAAIIGLCLGGACCSKYLSVGLIAAPVLAVMLAMCVLRPRGSGGVASSRLRRLAHVLLAGVLAIAAMSPWLIRNQVAVGNPVFPLASDILGRGYWGPQEQQRWMDGHGPEKRAPVPPPPGYRPQEAPGRLVLLWNAFLEPQDSLFGQVTVALFAISVVTMLVGLRRTGPWDWALLGIFVVQVLVWMFATHEMPARFIVPALVPMALLVGGFLSRLSRVKRAGGLAWGLVTAIVLLAAAVAVNLLVTNDAFTRAHDVRTGVIGQGGEDLTIASRINGSVGDGARQQFPADAKFLLVGDLPFTFADGSLYATAFDRSPLLELSQGATPREFMDRLRERHVDYIWVGWSDLVRLSRSYGIPAELSGEMYSRMALGMDPALGQIEQLKALGLVEVYSYRLPVENSRAFRVNTADGKMIIWPHTTLYALPWASFRQLPGHNQR